MSHSYGQNTISDLLIATICSGRSSRAFRSILRERAFQRFKESSVRTAFNRLKNKNLIENKSNEWRLSAKGWEKMQDRERFSFLPSPFAKNAPNKAIVSFDVSQDMSRERTWLRNQLKIFGFKMIHQSLWMGPGPLPDKFNKKASNLGLKDCMRIFKLAK